MSSFANRDYTIYRGNNVLFNSNYHFVFRPVCQLMNKFRITVVVESISAFFFPSPLHSATTKIIRSLGVREMRTNGQPPKGEIRGCLKLTFFFFFFFILQQSRHHRQLLPTNVCYFSYSSGRLD